MTCKFRNRRAPCQSVFTFPGIELSFFYRLTGASGDIRAKTSKLKPAIDSSCDEIRNVDQICSLTDSRPVVVSPAVLTSSGVIENRSAEFEVERRSKVHDDIKLSYLGLTDNEIRVLKSIFTLAPQLSENFSLTSPANLDDVDVFLVDADDEQSIARWKLIKRQNNLAM